MTFELPVQLFRRVSRIAIATLARAWWTLAAARRRTKVPSRSAEPMAHGVVPWVDPIAPAEVLHPATDTDWAAIVTTYAGADTPFARVVAVARESGCRTVVIEHRYIDLDFRGEHSAFWSMRFDVPSPFTRRLHFFSTRIEEDQLHELPEDSGYLGYTVLRPLRIGRVGRTVLAVPTPPQRRDARDDH